ncbi:MAG TPA: hypothetical protein VD997_05565 [Phycisphaerales bacterium]|nr:hypothetical protein [Phycisphaerales bacterium]
MRFETLTVGTTKLPWPLVAAALAVMPLLGVAGVRMLKRAPSSAFGQETPTVTPFKPAPETTPTANAVALVSQFNAEASRGFGPSPMLNRAPPPPVQPKVPDPEVKPRVVDEPPVRVSTPQQATPPELQITSIMATNKGSVAVINGKLRRVGDAVGNGYKIAAINAGTGEVEIVGAAGDKVMFQFKKRVSEE